MRDAIDLASRWWVIAALWLCLLCGLFGPDRVARWIEAVGTDGIVQLARQVRVGAP